MVSSHLLHLQAQVADSRLSLAAHFKDDPLDPARGQRYRDKILRVGGSQDELTSLKVCSPCSSVCCTKLTNAALRTSWDASQTPKRS